MIPLFYREEGGGGLRSNNRSLSLEMSAVTLGDCPTGQRHFCKKPRYKMSVENSMKFCDKCNETLRHRPETSTCQLVEMQSQTCKISCGKLYNKDQSSHVNHKYNPLSILLFYVILKWGGGSALQFCSKTSMVSGSIKTMCSSKQILNQ